MQFAHLKGIVQWLLLYQQSLVTITTTNFRIFQSPPKETLLFIINQSSLSSAFQASHPQLLNH